MWPSLRQTILAGDLNAKHPFWNSSVSNPSGEELLELIHKNELEISEPHCTTHYSPAGKLTKTINGRWRLEFKLCSKL
jgi:hypothetical protein